MYSATTATCVHIHATPGKCVSQPARFSSPPHHNAPDILIQINHTYDGCIICVVPGMDDDLRGCVCVCMCVGTWIPMGGRNVGGVAIVRRTLGVELVRWTRCSEISLNFRLIHDAVLEQRNIRYIEMWCAGQHRI